MIARKEPMEVIVTLSDKRLITMDEFCVYASVGLAKARELSKLSGALFKVGARTLVDRVKFDRWCDERNEA